MWDNEIGRHIRRCNRNLFLTNAVIVAALLLWAYSSERYLYNCFAGPFPKSHDELFKLTDPGEMRHFFVSVEQLEPLETGLETIERTRDKYTHDVKSEKVAATYFAAPIDNKLLLIKSPTSFATSHYDGEVQSVPDEVRAYFQKELLDSRGRKFDDVFLPYVLDAGNFRANAYWALLIGLPVGLLAAFNICKAVRRMNNIELCPIFRSLNRFDEPSTVATNIEQELRSQAVLSPVSSIRLSPSWLLYESFFGLDVLRLGEIVWIYEKVTKHSYNFIPTGKTHAVVIGDQRGGRLEVDAGRGKAKEQVPHFIQVLVNRIPWVIAGYSNDLNRAFEKEPQAFVAAVAERRQEYLKAVNA